MSYAELLFAKTGECAVCEKPVPALFDLTTGSQPTALYRWTMLTASPGIFFCSPRCEFLYDRRHANTMRLYRVEYEPNGSFIIHDRSAPPISATTARLQRKLYGLADHMPRLRSQPDWDACGPDEAASVSDEGDDE